MSKAIITALVVGVVAMAGVLVGACSAGAAELLAQPQSPRHPAQPGVALAVAFTSATPIIGNYDRPTV